MATLSAMFKLYDSYSSTVNKIIAGSDRAANAVLGASKKTDEYNESLKRTNAAAGVANTGLSRLIGTVMSLIGVTKAMESADMYTNTNARLAMITDGLEEQKALQADIFASADRARGSYVDMANAAAKLKMLAGDSFTSNAEAVGFAELLTKSLKVSGAGQAEQNSAFLQLTQAMTSGKLQGDEFRSVMENAPMVADAIATYMGKSKAELKELSSEGLITADIIKGAMFSAADDINSKFGTMPMTFADVWQKIKNTGMQAFEDVFKKANTMLNSELGQNVVENLTGAVYIAAGAFSVLLDAIGWAGENLDMLAPFVWALVGAWTAYNVVLGVTNGLTAAATAAQTTHAAMMAMESGITFAATVQQYGFNAALMACPITWVIGGIMLLIAAFYAGTAAVNHFAGTSYSATGLIMGAFFTAGAFIYNTVGGTLDGILQLALAAAYPVIGIVEWVLNTCLGGFDTFEDWVANLIGNIIGWFLSLGKVVSTVMDAIFGSDWTSRLTDLQNEYTSVGKNENAVTIDRSLPSLFKRIDYGTAWDKGYGVGSSLADKASNLFSGATPDFSSPDIDFSGLGTSGNPVTVKGTGKGGAVKIENEEDLQWMRRLAERDYVARISQNTLAPSIHVEFSGPITKEADTDNVAAHLAEQLKEIIATAPEGVPT